MAAAKIYPTVESVTAGLTMIGKVALVTGTFPLYPNHNQPTHCPWPQGERARVQMTNLNTSESVTHSHLATCAFSPPLGNLTLTRHSHVILDDFTLDFVSLLLFHVLGGYNGLGAQTAQGLLAVGAKVIVAGRNPKRVEHFVKNNQSEDGRLSGVLVDLSDLSTLKQFKEAVGSVTDKVDVLINNAGVMNCPPGLTAQGYELQVGTNAIGTVGVTEALLPLIRSSAAGRIVNVSAYAHQWKPHDVPWNPESIHLNEETYKVLIPSPLKTSIKSKLLGNEGCFSLVPSPSSY